jgi:hypothetical protein
LTDAEKLKLENKIKEKKGRWEGELKELRNKLGALEK